MADREARLREKFLNRESAKQIEEEEKSKPEIFQVKPSTDKPKVDIQKICKLQEIKEGFSKFMDKVHTVMFLLAGIFLAANIKRNIVPQFTSFTMLFALLEICLQLYKSIVHKFQFQDLQAFMEENKDDDLLKKFIPQSALGGISKATGALGYMSVAAAIVQDLMVYLVFFLLTLSVL